MCKGQSNYAKTSQNFKGSPILKDFNDVNTAYKFTFKKLCLRLIEEKSYTIHNHPSSGKNSYTAFYLVEDLGNV